MTTRLDVLLPQALPRGRSGPLLRQRFSPEATGPFGIHETFQEDLLADLRASRPSDGYLFGVAASRFAVGMSCGAILPLLELFPGVPRGLVVADTDLAVVCAFEMLLDCAAHNADPAGFRRELCGGAEEGWHGLEERMLARRRQLGLALPGEDERERLWEGLRRLGGVPTAVPVAGEPVSFWDRLAPVHARLHSLAASGRAVAVQAHLFDPDLLAAVVALPGFAESVNVVYLSNVVDTEARRILFASGRFRLGLSDGEEVDLGSTPDFVGHINAELRRLGSLAGAGRKTIFLHSSESVEGVLMAGLEVPQQSPADFFLQIDLNRVAAAFFESPEDEESATSDAWSGARAYRRAVLSLFGAAVRRDREAVAAALARVARETSSRPLAAGAEPAYAAFRIAELAEALLMVRRDGAADPSPDLAALEEAVRAGIGELVGGEGAPPRGAAAWELFLFAHAFVSAGRLLNAPSLTASGRRLAKAGLDMGGEVSGPPGLRIEALRRLLQCEIHDPHPAARAAVARGVARLSGELRPDWEVRGGSDRPPAGGYAAYAQADDVACEGVRLLFLFYGLLVEELDPVRAVFLIRPGRGLDGSPAPEVAS